MPALLGLLLVLPNPLDRLVGEWVAVQGPSRKEPYASRSTNSWVFKSGLLECRLAPRKGEKGEERILLRFSPDGKVRAFWHHSTDDYVYEGTVRPDGIEFAATPFNTLLRPMYRWIGPDAYEFKIQRLETIDSVWIDKVVRLYRRKGVRWLPNSR